MQQQQQPRDRVAAMQQMAGTSEFQPPARPARGDRPQQVDAGDRRASADAQRDEPVRAGAARDGDAPPRGRP